jgi:hypothetical protein
LTRRWKRFLSITIHILIRSSSCLICLLHDVVPLFTITVSISKCLTDVGCYKGFCALNKSLVLCPVTQPKALVQLLKCFVYLAHAPFGCSNTLLLKHHHH